MTTDTPAASSRRRRPRSRRKFEFPGAITTLAVVMVAVWIAALFIPSGRFATDESGAPVPGTYERVDSALTFPERLRQLVLAPVEGLYGVQDPVTGFVDTDNLGTLFGSIGVVLFIMALGVFISVSFATRALEVAVARLGVRLRTRGWLLIATIMVLFSVLGTTMGFSVETFGFYALVIPLMLALGYDRMVAAATIVLGALIGCAAATVNPFSIGVASGEAGVSLGDGIVLRVVLWLVMTALAVAYVVRYAARVQRDPSLSLVGFAPPESADPSSVEPTSPDDAAYPDEPERMSRLQVWVLVVTAATFAVMIFSVIPWSAIFGAATAPAEYDQVHEVATEPYWFELNWWFPELSMLFVGAALLVGVIARMGEKRLVSLVTQGAADMVGPAIVIMLARGVSVIMNNTETLDTILDAMESIASNAGGGLFAILVAIVNVPLAFLIPSSSGHATLAMPLLAPLGDFVDVARPLVITAWQMGHGLTMLVAPTNVVVVGGLAMAGVGFDKYLRFVWPLILACAVVAAVGLGIAGLIG